LLQYWWPQAASLLPLQNEAEVIDPLRLGMPNCSTPKSALFRGDLGPANADTYTVLPQIRNRDDNVIGSAVFALLFMLVTNRDAQRQTSV